MIKKTIFLIIVVFVLSALLETNLNASVVRGKRYYIKYLKKPCGFKGNIMGKEHTVNEWQMLYKSGKLGFELKRLCPKSSPITSQKILKNLSSFLKYFASDSGNIPSCSD